MGKGRNPHMEYRLRRIGRRFRAQPGHFLTALFALSVLLPGLLLAIFGFRALRQERSRADQEIHERMDRAADMVAGALERQFRDWQDSVDQLPPAGIVDPEKLPQKMRRAMEEPGSVLWFWRDSTGINTHPPGWILMDPSPEQTPDAPPPSEFAAAESLELRDKDYAKAISAYEKLLAAYPRERSRLLMMIARSYRKTGKLESAAARYREVERDARAHIGGTPADLAARYELCSILSLQGMKDALRSEALRTYSDLVHGRWRLDEFRYVSYSEGLRAWLDSPAPAEYFTSLRAEEERALRFNRAVMPLLRSQQRFVSTESRLAVCFSRSHPFAGLILSGSYIQDRLWPEVAAAAGSPDFAFRVLDGEGKILLATEPADLPHSASSRSLEQLGLPWRLQVQHLHPESLYAEYGRRQSFYLFVVITALALLLSGGYLTLRTARREMEVAKLKSDFVSTVSHEFRSPLTGIRHVGELLREGRVKSEARRQEYYGMICRESGRLARLVENLLDFSRMEEGRKEYRFAPLETIGWLRDLAEEFQAENTASGVKLELSLPSRLPALKADREALSCAVHNLLDNAVKYSPDIKTVWLEAEACGSEIIIRVRDLGVGIAEADQRHIFEKFYRGANAAAETKGVGLGLALAVHIVRDHGGTIEVQSKPGAGSTFSMHLPKASQRSHEKAGEP
jgi:signal transduction histidine kinase